MRNTSKKLEMGKKSEADALNIAGLAYDTAMGGDNWTDVLKQITDHINAKSSMLRMVDYTRSQIGFFDSIGIDPTYRQAYSRHYMNVDIYRSLFETAPVGVIMQSCQIPGYEQRHKTEFFNDYQKPQDMEHVCGSVLVRNDNLTIQFGAHRSKHASDFGQDEFGFLQTVLPHLVRAVQIRQTLAAKSSQQALTEAALHQMRFGVLLTDAQARPIFINRRAEHYIAASNGALNLSLCGLRMRKPEDTAYLCRLVANAASTTTGKGLSIGGEIRIACGNGDFLQLCVTPLSQQYHVSGSVIPSACAMIFITQPGNVQLHWHRIAVCYGLTQSEAKLAAQLASGRNLKEAAEQLGISIHTVRTHLKAIFVKTGVRRQSELVALLLQGTMAFCRTDEEGITTPPF